MAVQSNVLTSALSTLSTSAGNAVSDLSSVSAGADVLASQFADVKVALQNLQSLATTMSASGFYVPVGSLMPFAASAAPDGWYLCNGATWASLSLSAGSPLYDLLQPLGYAGVPDLQGRTVVGKGVNGAVDVLGDHEGILIANVADRSPFHKHSLSGSVTNAAAISTEGQSATHTHTATTSTEGSHQHTYSRAQTVSDARRGTSASAAFNDNADALTVAAGAHGHTMTVGNASVDHTHMLPIHGHANDFAVGTGAGINDTMPFLTLNYIIKS